MDDARKHNLGENGLESFRKRYRLSIRELARVCGDSAAGISKSTIERLCRGQHPTRPYKVLSAIERALEAYLLALGKESAQIETELEAIFEREKGKEMTIPRTTLPAEVQEVFKLRRDPFTVEEPRRVGEGFTWAQLDRLAGKVEDAINYQNFLAVVGEVGSGKTLLKRRIMESAEGSRGRIRILWPEFFEMKKVRAASIVSYLLASFDQTAPQDLLARAAKLKSTLADVTSEGVRVALGFDEAHRLNDEMLMALKNFYELGEGYDRYLGVILFAQPQFEGRLRDFRFRELAERIDVVRMPPVEKYAYDYLAHRIKLAGGSMEDLFEREAVALLWSEPLIETGS